MRENIYGSGIMTAEPFTITGHRSISDHTLKRLYDLSDFDGIISVTERLNKLAETNRKQSEIIEWLIDALKDDDKLLKDNNVSYIVNNTLDDLVKGKISINELLEDWDND